MAIIFPYNIKEALLCETSLTNKVTLENVTMFEFESLCKKRFSLWLKLR